MTGVGSLIAKVTLSAKRTENLAYTTSLFNQVATLLQDPEICTGSLEDKIQLPVTRPTEDNDLLKSQVREIKNAGQTLMTIHGENVPTSGDVKLTEIIVKEVDATAKTAELELKFEALSGTLLRKTHELKLSVQTEGTEANTKITSCTAVGGGSNVDCYKVTDEGAEGGKKQSLVGCGGTIDSTTDNLTAFGYSAGSSNTTGDGNSFVGFEAGKLNLGGHHNSFFGYQAGISNIKGSKNTLIGYQSGYSITGPPLGETSSVGSYNTFVGYQTGHSNTIGNNNNFIGFRAGYSNTTGYFNNFFGVRAGYDNTTGVDNTFIGSRSGYKNTTGEGNIAIGYDAGFRNLKGNDNIFIGRSVAGIKISDPLPCHNNKLPTDTTNCLTGNNNIFMGKDSGRFNTTGNLNKFIGTFAGYHNTTGRDNIFIGYLTGHYNKTGRDNTFIGSRSGITTTGSRNIFIGKNTTGVPVDDGQLNIGNLITGKGVNLTTPLTPPSDAKVTIHGDLHVKGSITYTGTSTTSSDRRLKKKIKNLDNQLDHLLKLKPKTYYWKDKSHTKKKQLGLIAQ